jgi:hypothetical protein
MNPLRFRLVRFLLPACLFLMAGPHHTYAQGKQAIAILRPSGGATTATGCEGTSDINYQLIRDFKLNNEDEVRLISDVTTSAGASASVSRKSYEKSGKSKLRDLAELKWGNDGVLFAVSVSGQAPIVAVPDNMKPTKNNDQPLSSFYSVTIAAEAIEGKQKRRVSLALHDIWKIYFVPDGANINDYLYRHAAEEKNVTIWDAYLKRTNNYRASEANTMMRDALIVCARSDFDRFTGGNYAALENARSKNERAQSVRDDETTRQLALDIRQAREKVDKLRAQAEQLIKDSKWDEAITAAEPIKIYLTTWPELNSLYNHALKQSHEIHLFKGEEALRANQLEVARENCTTAWQRLPDSTPARTCVCESRTRITLRDTKNFRQQKHPKEAKELLEKQLADSDCTQDTRLLAELKESKCEYAQQLLAEARRLLSGNGAQPMARTTIPVAAGRRQGRARPAGQPVASPALVNLNVKAINAQNKKDFREAREKLVLAAEMCSDEPVRLTLNATNRRLADFCISEAQKAAQRDDDGTAYVYLQTAQGYAPEDGNLAGMLSQARDHFEQRTRVNIGAVIGNSSGGSGTEQVVNEVAAEIESAATEAGLSQPVVLERQEAANALRSIQGGRALRSPTIIFFGDLLSANLRRDATPRYVSSSFSYSNPRWEDADREHDAVNADYKRCVKQLGEAQCGGLRDRVMTLRAYRDRIPRTVTENYTYQETTFSVNGNLKMSFRALDSITHSTRVADTLEASVSQQCTQREGVNPKDYSVANFTCNVPEGNQYLSDMINQLRRTAHIQAYGQLSQLALSYYSRAHTGANRQQSIEDYLRFLFLTRDKRSSEASEAQRFLVSFDPELKTDGVMR